MDTMLGVGVPAWPAPDGGWAWWFPAIAAIALATLPLLSRVPRRSVRFLAGAVVLGFVGAWAIDRWGTMPTVAVAALASSVCLGLAATQRRRHPPPV